jgi:hypothetical protein
MTLQQLNPYTDLLVACSGDQRYGGERSFDDPVLVSVRAGELSGAAARAR